MRSKHIHIYTPEEISWLREHAAGRPMKETAEEFQTLYDPHVSITGVIEAMKRRGIKSGVGGKFKPGHIPANKGKKLTPEQYEKARGGMFKNGNTPHNTLPIGAEKVLSDGYTWVKIDNKPHAKKQENWKQKHRLIYEQHHGPVDPRARIVFLDQDRSNFDIDNLYCLNESELMSMNKTGRWSDNPNISMAGIAVTKLNQAVNRRTKGNDTSR